MKILRLMVAATAASLLMAASVQAALVPFQSFTGNVGYSSDGFGSTSQTGTISAKVPVGATVLAAYLYTGLNTFSGSYAGINNTTLNGTAVTFGPVVANSDGCCGIASARADVTSIVKPIADGGAAGVFDFAIVEGSGGQDGEALVVVYSLPSLPVATFAILDGFARTLGDTTTVNFGIPLDPTNPAFFAEMSLGINFSCCSSQRSTVTVNGTTMTENAGNNDDGAAVANGSLITVGGFDDPFSTLLPSYDADHERYNLAQFVNVGDTQIKIDTFNTSRDDNIFLASFYVLGIASVCQENCSTVPEPSSLALIGLGLAALGLRRRPMIRRAK